MSHSTAHSHDDHGAHGHGDGEFAHPAPLSMLFGVFFALVVLTLLTVYQSTFDLGNMEVWLSLTIATVKAALVILFFMHMLWDKPFNAILFISTLIFVGLFLGFTLMDANAYKNSIEVRDTLKESLPKAPSH
ncbi:MAG: cytochrome C oxidase subunit IV family protein [Pirellulales bacterium]